jgi:hypothetical protein
MVMVQPSPALFFSETIQKYQMIRARDPVGQQQRSIRWMMNHGEYALDSYSDANALAAATSAAAASHVGLCNENEKEQLLKKKADPKVVNAAPTCDHALIADLMKAQKQANPDLYAENVKGVRDALARIKRPNDIGFPDIAPRHSGAVAVLKSVASIFKGGDLVEAQQRIAAAIVDKRMQAKAEQLMQRGGGQPGKSRRRSSSKWVSTGRRVQVASPRGGGVLVHKVVYRSTATGELRVRKMVRNRATGGVRVTYVPI